MSTNLNQIDELRKRASVSYTDAKEALEKCNGDMLEALVYLEKNNKGQWQHSGQKTGFFDKINGLIKKGSNTRFIMQKHDRVVFNVSVNIAVLITILTLPFIEFIAIGFLIALFTGHRFKLQGSNVEVSQINQALDRVCEAAEDIKERFAEKKQDNADHLNK